MIRISLGQLVIAVIIFVAVVFCFVGIVQWAYHKNDKIMAQDKRKIDSVASLLSQAEKHAQIAQKEANDAKKHSDSIVFVVLNRIPSVQIQKNYENKINSIRSNSNDANAAELIRWADQP